MRAHYTLRQSSYYRQVVYKTQKPSQQGPDEVMAMYYSGAHCLLAPMY